MIHDYVFHLCNDHIYPVSTRTPPRASWRADAPKPPMSFSPAPTRRPTPAGQRGCERERTSSSIGGVLLSAVGDPLVLTIGASCAVLGIVGVLSVFLFMVWLKFLAPSCFCWQDGDRDEIQLFRALCLFSVLVAGLTFVAGALTPAVDNWGHVGGFVTGILLGPAFMPSLPTNGLNTTFFSRNFQWMSVALLCILVFRLLLHMYTMPLQNNPMKC